MVSTFEVIDNKLNLNLIDNTPHNNIPLPSLPDADYQEQLALLQRLGQSSLKDLQDQGVFIFPPISSTANQQDDLLLADDYERGIHANNRVFPSCSLNESSEGNSARTISLQTGNLVGFIGGKGLNISIRSRFAYDNQGDFFLHYLMQRNMRLNAIDLPVAVSDSDAILNFLVLLFPSYLERALRQGVFKQYQNFCYNDSKLKGTIDVARHLKCNLPFQGNIAYHTREFSFDNPVTQLVRHTIEVIRSNPGFSKLLELNDEVIAAVRQIEEVTPSYERSDLVAVVNANLRPVSHPLLTEYRPLQQLCLKILRQEDVGLRFNADSEPVYGVLFDIAYLWEEYLALLLKPLGFEHPSNVANHGWPVANLDGKDVMRFCPDFVFPDTQGIKPPTASLVADAKYTRYETKRFDDRTKHHVLQMLHYMYMLKAQRSVLLSPAHIDEPKQWPFVLYGYGGTIGVEYLTMPSQAQSYAVFCAAMQQAENDFVEKIKPYLAAN